MCTFSALRERNASTKAITLPDSGIVLHVRPVSLFDTALAGDIPAGVVKDLSDLDKGSAKLAQKADKVDGDEVLANVKQQAAFGRKLIKLLAQEPDDTPFNESIKNDEDLALLGIADLMWFRAAALAGFPDAEDSVGDLVGKVE